MRKTKLLLLALFLIAAFAAADNVKAEAKNQLLLKSAVITAIDTGTQTITAVKNNVSYTIDASNAAFYRRYNAKCDIYELMTGDYIWIWGIMSGTNIAAKKVKDYSIQKWKGSFVGTITYVDPATYTDNKERNFQQFEIQSRHRGDQTVRVYDTTQIKYKKESKTFSDLAIGQEVVAKGIWNNTHSLVYDTNWIKIRKLVE